MYSRKFLKTIFRQFGDNKIQRKGLISFGKTCVASKTIYFGEQDLYKRVLPCFFLSEALHTKFSYSKNVKNNIFTEL